MKTIKGLFDIVLTGDKEASRVAARQVRKMVYGSHDGKYEEILSIINKAPATYSKITEGFRQENFVRSISIMYFLHSQEDKPDFLFPWMFQLLQHDNGNIRHAVVRMIEHELGPLTYHVRFPDKKTHYSKISNIQADQILFGLRTNLENLATSSYKPSFEKYKYIHSLPSGTYKSVQLILWYLEDCCDDISVPESVESNNEILARRTEIEQEIADLLIETGSDFTLDHIKEIIYNEVGQSDLTEIISMFDNGQGVVELGDVLELVSDAWNYFPHKILGGFSPAEKLLKYEEDQS